MVALKKAVWFGGESASEGGLIGDVRVQHWGGAVLVLPVHDVGRGGGAAGWGQGLRDGPIHDVELRIVRGGHRGTGASEELSKTIYKAIECIGHSKDWMVRSLPKYNGDWSKMGNTRGFSWYYNFFADFLKEFCEFLKKRSEGRSSCEGECRAGRGGGGVRVSESESWESHTILSW